MADAVSFSRQVALIFAFHCNQCHAVPPGTAAADFVTATYAGVMAAVVPGDPAASLLMEYIDGRRRKRMPLGAAPLPASDVALIGQWITEGARNDRADFPVLEKRVAVRRGKGFTVVCRVPARAYLRLAIVGARDEVLYREETALLEGGEARWPLIAGARWPREVTARVEVAFTDQAAVLTVE